jgi:DNA-directed RNA polymerase specialized sigma24 family protein
VPPSMDERIRAYLPLIESLARKFVGRNGAEYDDLVQEGMVMVWQTLERGITPAVALIEARMHDWARLLGTQTGRGRGASGEAIEYATLLPLDRVIGIDEAGDDLLLVETLTYDNTVSAGLDPIPLPGHDPLA